MFMSTKHFRSDNNELVCVSVRLWVSLCVIVCLCESVSVSVSVCILSQKFVFTLQE